MLKLPQDHVKAFDVNSRFCLQFTFNHERSIRRSNSGISSEIAGLSAGSQVSVKGGRFKGRVGKIVEVRIGGGVVRVQMEGPEGPVEADMAAAHCIAA